MDVGFVHIKKEANQIADLLINEGSQMDDN